MLLTRLLAPLILMLVSICAQAQTSVVEMKTSQGVIIIELNGEKAPNTVANFLQYVKDGHYSGTIFHRVISGFMIQGGGMDKNLNEKPTRDPIRNCAVFHQCRQQHLSQPHR